MTTPTPEAIEAAEAAVRKYYSMGGWVRTADVAKLAVQAAYPLMEAQAKAEALREAAEVWGAGLGLEAFAEHYVEDDVSAVQATTKWLDERANEIEGKGS